MKKSVTYTALLALFMMVLSTGAFAQTTVTSGTVNPKTEIDQKEFPLWAKDLRRGEIVAFGSFPFTMFFTTFAIDTWRWSTNDMDQKYAPWPFKTSGAISMTTEEHEQTMLIAAAVSVTLALTDFVIVKIKRYKQAQKARKMPVGSPIIIKQMHAEEGEGASSSSQMEPSVSGELR
jgi:hypothetical protein